MIRVLYRAALRLLPQEFRSKYGRDMLRLFDSEVQRGFARGRLRGTWVALAGLGDVVRRGLYERLRRSERGREVVMQDVARDVQEAIRSLRKAPRFTLVAVATLTLGIGANGAIFSVVDGVMLTPLHFPNAERFVHLGWIWEGDPTGTVPAFKYEYWKSHAESYDAMATYRGTLARLGADDGVQGLSGLRVSQGFLDVLGYEPVRGRGFTDDETIPQGPPVVILTHGTWLSRFGGDPDVIGRTVELNEAPHTVVGVLPSEFEFPQLSEPVDVLLPLGLEADPRDEGQNWPIIALLREDVTPESAQAELDRITRSFRDEYPQLVGDREVGMALTSYHELYVGDLRRTLWIVLGAVALVLLIACANVASLLLARGSHRRREIAVRMALGASRSRVRRYVLIESLVLATVAGALGLAVAACGIRALVGLAPPGIPRLDEVSVDAAVLGFTFLVSLVTGLLFGAIVAWAAGRAGLGETMKAGSRGTTGAGHRARQALLLTQAAMSMVLLVGAGLLVATLLNIRGVDPGFDARDVVTVRFPWRPEGYARSVDIWEMERRVHEVLERDASILAAAGAANLPLERGMNIPVAIAGRPDDFEGAVEYRAVTPGYFETLDIDITRGRAFDRTDEPGAPGVAIVSESFVRRYFPDENPIGRAIEIGRFRGRYVHPDFDVPPLRVVGVAEDVRDRSLKSEPARTVYVPQGQAPDVASSMPVFLVRSHRPADAARAVLDAVRTADGDIPSPTIRTMEEIVGTSLARERFNAFLLSGFAALALLLTAFGIYGVVAFAIRRRRREIGIRMAMGAGPGGVARLVTRQGMKPVLIGLVIGTAGALLLARVVEGLVWGVSPTDPANIAMVGGVLLGVALLASWLPAREATRVDPVRVLSAE